MKIVIDTNVFLSSLFSKNGASHKLVLWIINQYKYSHKKYNVISNTLITEYEDVLTRDKNIEKISSLKTLDYLESGANKGSVNNMLNLLESVQDIEPQEYDKL